MDVVYLLKPDEGNEELRFSLRSLANLTHERVWLAGYRPTWVNEVGHIPTRQNRDRHVNTTLNMWAACQHPEVSDPFILFNDDFFAMHRIVEVPTWHRGTVAQFIRRPNVVGQYGSGAGATAELLHRLGYDDPLCYEVHAPLVVHKQVMLRALDLGRGVRTLHKRTLYGNLADLGGYQHADVKVHGDEKPDERWPFWSTEDFSFSLCRVGDLIRGRFGTPSRYELEPAEIEPQEGTDMQVFVNTRTGVVAQVSDPSEVKGRKAAVHARRTIEQMDRSKRWRRATRADLPAAKTAGATEPQSAPENRGDGAHAVGGGWFEVVVGGEVVDKVRGQDAANDSYVEHTS